MSQADQIFKEIKNDHRKAKIVSFIKKYKNILITVVSIIVLVIIIYSAITIYLNYKANKNSIIFSNVQQSLYQNNEKQAIEQLTTLSKSGTAGYKLVSLLQLSSLAIHNANHTKAIDYLQQIKHISVPQYYKDYADYTITAIKLDNSTNIQELSMDIKKSLNKKSAFYYSNLEFYAITLYELKDYKNALNATNEIIDADTSSTGLKERAKNLKSLLLAYIK